MHAPEFERFLDDLGRSIRLRPAQRGAIREELTDHFEALVDDMMSEGMTREAATHAALRDFGDAVDLARRFGRIGRGRTWIMRSTIAASLVAATAIVTSFMVPDNPHNTLAPPRASGGGQDAPRAPTGVSVDVEARSPADKRIEDALDTIVPEVKFEAVALAKAIQYLGDLTGINLHVNWSALEDAGIARDAEVTLSVKGVSLRSILELMLEDLGKSTPLAYSAHQGILRISTAEAISRQTVVRIYDCHELVDPALNERERSVLIGVLQHWKHTQTVISGPEKAEGPPETDQWRDRLLDEIDHLLSERRMTQLKTLIQNTVLPDSWSDNGGSIGRITSYRTTLVITQTPRQHAEIENLLGRLARSLGRTPLRPDSAR